ncbi:MAG TPA: hypothetical protein VLG27_02720 [Candidatus Saccharimonadia bacterium]|nr:hypothetical protein [Candidatus Saccharimonadia bacterium]
MESRRTRRNPGLNIEDALDRLGIVGMEGDDPLTNQLRMMAAQMIRDRADGIRQALIESQGQDGSESDSLQNPLLDIVDAFINDRAA